MFGNVHHLTEQCRTGCFCYPRVTPEEHDLSLGVLSMPALTVRSIEKIQPQGARRELADSHCPGLYLIVQPSGAKGWAVRYRACGRPRKHTLGRYPSIGLIKAR